MINLNKIFHKKNLIWECHSFSKPISNNAGKYSNNKRFISTSDLKKFVNAFGTEILVFGSRSNSKPFSNVAICTTFNVDLFRQNADLANYEKHITDVLVTMGILKNDSFKHVKANLQIGGQLEKDVTFKVQIFKMGDAYEL